MKMYLEQRRQAILQLHLNDQQVYNCLRCDYVMLCYVMLRYVTARYVTLRYVTLHYITLYYIFDGTSAVVAGYGPFGQRVNK